MKPICLVHAGCEREEEGVKFMFNRQPVEVVGDAQVSGVKL